MDKDRATTFMAVGFFFVLLIGFFWAYYFANPTSVATLDYEIKDVPQLNESSRAEQAQEGDLTGAAVTKSEEEKIKEYMEKPKSTAVFWAQIIVVFSLLVVYGVYRGGFLSRPKKFSDESLKKYFKAGIDSGHSVEELRNELARQKVPEAQINQVLQQIGKL